MLTPLRRQVWKMSIARSCNAGTLEPQSTIRTTFWLSVNQVTDWACKDSMKDFMDKETASSSLKVNFGISRNLTNSDELCLRTQWNYRRLKQMHLNRWSWKAYSFQATEVGTPLRLTTFQKANSVKLSEERWTWEFQDDAELIIAKRFLVIRRETLPTQLVSEIVFPQTLASSRTGTRTEDTDGIEFKTSCKLVIRSYCSQGSWRKFKSADDWSENSGSQRSSETTSASHLEDWAQLNCCREGQQTL